MIFFDVMTQLLVHIIEKLDIFGPIGARWMYHMEMHLKMLKGCVPNCARPKPNMVEGYAIDETHGFCMEYMHTTVWDDKEDPTMNNEIHEGVGRLRILTLELHRWIHIWS